MARWLSLTLLEKGCLRSKGWGEDQDKDFKEENTNFLMGKMCGRREYCRSHITRRAPLRGKTVSATEDMVFPLLHSGKAPQEVSHIL